MPVIYLLFFTIEKPELVLNTDLQDEDLIQNRAGRTWNDIFSCLQCIESLSKFRIVIDGVCMFHNILCGSKTFNGLKMDQKFQSLKGTLDLVQEFNFYCRFTSSAEAAGTAELDATEMLCLNPAATMTMSYLPHFWMNHQDIIGKIKCDQKGLKWLFTLCSHDIFVKELFMLFEDDVQCMICSLSSLFLQLLSHSIDQDI